MATLTDFLTSREVFITVLIAIAVCILGTIYFIIEKMIKKYKDKKEENLFNTTDNKIIKIVDNKVVVEPLVDININSVDENKKIKTPAIKDNIAVEVEKDIPQVINTIPIVEEQKKDDRLVIPIEELQEKQPIQENNSSIENIYKEVSQEVEKNHIDKIEYTEIEPNPEEAKEEIRKATEELLKTQELQLKDEIDLAKFEAEQEENAIISIDELYSKSKVLYEQNEVSQYQDEGNEPISISDLEMRMNKIKTDVEEIEKEDIHTIEENAIAPLEEKQQVVKLDDFNTINNSELYKEDKIFKSSPIISPIFGIEKQTNDMEFENTANYEKFDDEIRKTNEFLKVLKELQKKLE